MKKLIFIILFTTLVVLPCLSLQEADREVARTQDYITAATKKGVEKINALKAYIKKFPEKTSRWTRLAYYQLAVGYYEVKNYKEAIKMGEQRLKMGIYGKGEEGRLNLVLANSYGIKNTPQFNTDKALTYINRAIEKAKKSGDKDVLNIAKRLKKKLYGPSDKTISPEQKIKMLYSKKKYGQAISYYKTLGVADKGNFEIHLIYAHSLYKTDTFDSALKEYKTLYSKQKKGIIALRMGDIYSKKGKRDKALYDLAATYYVHANFRYKKEENSSYSKVALQKAEVALGDKYDYNKKAKSLQAKQEKSQASAKKNEQLIRKKQRELKTLLRKIWKEYEAIDIAPPPYLEEQVKKLQQEIAAFQSGVSADDSAEIAKLDELKKKIKIELETLKADVKKELNL